MSWEASGYVAKLVTTPSGEKMTRTEKLVALLLADRYNHDYGYAWPKIATLAEDAMLSVRMVQYALKSLEKKGVITIERRWKGPSECDTNAYRFPGLPLQGGGAMVAPGKISSPARSLHQGGADRLRQAGANRVAPKPLVNRDLTDTAGRDREEAQDAPTPADVHALVEAFLGTHRLPSTATDVEARKAVLRRQAAQLSGA
jgi:Helix-turn-helix domain